MRQYVPYDKFPSTRSNFVVEKIDLLCHKKSI